MSRAARTIPLPIRLLALAAALCVAVLGGVGARRAQVVGVALVEARTLAERADLAGALDVLARGTRAEPGSAELWEAAAAAARARATWGGDGRDLEAAVEAARHAAEADPRSSDRWLELGRLAVEAAQPRVALDALERARALDPDRQETLRLLADLHDAAGDPAAAEDLRAHLAVLAGAGGTP